MDMRKALDAKASGLMIMLCMIWGLQQVVLKLAAVDIAPIMQIAIRCGLSALMVYPLIRLPQGVSLFSKDYLLAGMWLAFLFSAEFFLVAEALRFTSASHTVVLLYTAPIFVALGLNWKFASERLSVLQWTGIFIAFVGIVVTFMGKDSQTGQFSKVLLGDAMALLAGIMWALTTISLRLTKLAEAHPTQTLFYQLMGGFILLMPLAFALGQTEIRWTLLTFSSLAFHTLIMSFASLMIWFWLLRNYLANHLGVFSFLTPLFGIAFGIIFLDEKLEVNFIIGTALVMLGILVVSLQGWIQRKVLHISE
ncbi:DMT family transporter [Acinetobacter sp. WCHAc060025]|uniref:DMT family transporter n=1 Tax=Acinetobacter sp. WCHAc060025 TaxID=2518625 RepID=UPI0010235CF1|nr:DMT family transporter [Acinetobacter sp. WCHAc060025]RZG72844.1 DMT family transporter [Acinetobacter sp. WCHAc060025]